MRITIYSTLETSWGGSEMLWFNVAHLALEKKHKVQICIADKEENYRIESLRKSGATVIKRKGAFYFKYKLFRRLLDPSFLKEIEAFKPHVFLLSQGGCFEFLYNYSLFAMIEKLQIPFFLVSQFNFENGNILNKKFREELNVLKYKWQKFYFVSERNLLCAERQSSNKLPNVEIVSNALNIEKKFKAEWCEDKILRLCCVARYDCSYKGQDVLIETLSGPELRQFNYTLNFYGEGVDKDYLIELVHFYNLQDRIFINRHTNNVDDIFEKHHVLILPSIHEGMPLVLQECMLKGRPALVTNVGGCKTLVDDNTGFLAENCSVDSLKPALNKLFTATTAQLRLMGDAAHAKALQVVTINAHEHIFHDLLRAVKAA